MQEPTLSVPLHGGVGDAAAVEGQRTIARIGYDTRTWKTGDISGAAATCICLGLVEQAGVRGWVFATLAMPRRRGLLVWFRAGVSVKCTCSGFTCRDCPCVIPVQRPAVERGFR